MRYETVEIAVFRFSELSETSMCVLEHGELIQVTQSPFPLPRLLFRGITKMVMVKMSFGWLVVRCFVECLEAFPAGLRPAPREDGAVYGGDTPYSSASAGFGKVMLWFGKFCEA